MGIRIINYLRGYVTLLLTGQFIERFINICMHRNIFLWDIRKTARDSARVKMSMRAFKTVPEIARKTHTKIKILEKHGLPIRIADYRRRFLFPVGMLLAVSFLYGSSLFLWTVDVTGCEQVSATEIKAVLADLGVRPGAFKKSIRPGDIKNAALARLSDLSWLWVDIHGCRADVRVLEKRAAPEIVPDAPCDILAGADGIICEIIATEGQTKVAVGDTVTRGQVLISAVYTSAREGIPARYTHAAGKIYARTWYEASKTVPLTETKKIYTQNTHTDRSLHLGSLTLPLSDLRTVPYRHSERKRTTHDLVLFGKYTGITYRTDTYCEYRPETASVPIDVALRNAETELDQQICDMLWDTAAVRTDAHTSYTENGDGTITVKRTAEYKEQIGVEKAVNVL